MRTPVMIGSGQLVYRGEASQAHGLSPVTLAAQAAMRAIVDAGLPPESAAIIDVIAAVRLFSDSYVGGEHPFGRASKFPRAVAARIGAKPVRTIYGEVGGHTPQRLVNELCDAIAEGTHDMALVVGAEATGLLKAARRSGLVLDWSDETDGEMEDRGLGKPLVNRAEARHRLFAPVNVYALIEHAQRVRYGRSRAEHQRVMAALFSGFSAVASGNPYAQFPTVRDQTFLSTVSADNYLVSDPFTKWLVAQDAVNQGAAVLITSQAMADQLGVASDRRVYLHGYADADDVCVSERPSIGESRALKWAARKAFEAAQASAAKTRHFDFYSCFPCAVSAACEAFEVEASPGRPLTVTGGLPFFGGAGNSYSLFAIAEMVTTLRRDRGSQGVVSANGGYLSKQSVGIYGTTAPSRLWQRVEGEDLTQQLRRDAVSVAAISSGHGIIETFTVDFQNGKPAIGWALGRLHDADQRFIAQVSRGDNDTLAGLLTGEPIGRQVIVDAGEKFNSFRFTD